MRRFLYFITAMMLICSVKAQDVNCRFGFSYDISYNPHWGNNKPVITSVYPNSPAERAGVKPFDIIEAVEGEPVTENVLDDIHLFLNPPGKEVVELTLKNFKDEARKVKIQKECRSARSLSEMQLSTAFSMYSVENTHERLFSCPFVTNQTSDSIDFSQFKSFDFYDNNENQPELAKRINETIKKELTNRGLSYNPVDPDLRVQVYFSYTKNPNFRPAVNKKPLKEKESEAVYRYDIANERMVKLPFLPPGTIETEAEYFLKLGLRLEDQKSAKGLIIWESEINELASHAFSLEEFGHIHIPLMIMQFPYVKYARNVHYRLSKKKYNYTGINYSIDDISEIASVDPYSPAAQAGIRPYDKIDAIDNKRMDRTSQQFSSAYRQFLVNTIKLRDESTRFKDANGYPDCMYWDVAKYPLVVKAFNNKSNLTVFSYLFNFEPFINPLGNNTCSFKLRRFKDKLEFLIRPEIRSEITVVVE